MTRLNNLRGTTSRSRSMEETEYKGKIKGLPKMELMIGIMLKEVTPDHVTYEDRESYKEKLVKIGEKYVKWRDEVTDLMVELDPDDATDNARVDQIKSSIDNVVKLVAEPA